MAAITNFKDQWLNEYFEIYTSAHSAEPVSFQRFLRNTVLLKDFDENSFFTAVEDGVPVGFIYAPQRDGTGFITMLSVKSGYDIAGIGGMLLDRALEYHEAAGLKSLTTGYFPIYINQGHADGETDYVQLFMDRGFRETESVSRKLMLSEREHYGNIEEIRERLKGEGIYVGELRPEYVRSFLDPNAPFSSESWAFEFRSRLENKLDFTSVHVAAVDGKVIGACIFSDPNSDDMRFGPYGVNPEYQGRGIGKVLLEDTLSEMERRGLEYAWMQWTPKSGAASFLYEKFGFRILQNYMTFFKKIQ